MSELPVAVMFRKHKDPLDQAVLMISQKLLSLLGDNLLLVESFSGGDGSNVRVVVREKTDEVLDLVLGVVSEVEDELGLVGVIFPDVVTPDELRMQMLQQRRIPEKALEMLRKRLLSLLGDNLLLVESFSGGDGSNVRVVVREKTDEVLDLVLGVVSEVEDELGLVGVIFPDVVTPDEVQEVSR